MLCSVLKTHASSPAVDAVLHHALPATSLVKKAIPDAYVLQFAALMNDVVAQKCIKELGNESLIVIILTLM